MSQLLIEFLCEEIPSRMQTKAAQDMHHMLSEQLTSRGLTFSQINTFVTPRRLTVIAHNVPDQQAEVTQERRGPRVDAPQAALEGFTQSTGLRLDQCEQRETPKGTFYFAMLTQPAQETTTILPALIQHLITQFPWPKSMCWGRGPQTRWIRPLHNILCVFNGQAQDLNLPIPSLAHTQGHRFLSTGPVTFHDETSYVENLRAAHVLACPTERRATLAHMVQKAAQAKNLTVTVDEALLDEVTGLVEWPTLLMGHIDQRFMDLPREILVTVMRHHQRYFALETADGHLAPYFITIANSLFSDGGATATRGNEHVLRARLSDAMFFWHEDQKKPLADHALTLSRLIFHAQLGTVADKCTRIGQLAQTLNTLLGFQLDVTQVALAAQLMKADLATQTVIELPELQGQIGYHLARHEGLSQDLALAIRDHYAPTGATAPVAQAPLSQLMSLSDKLDTLAGFFLINEKPTGSKDPYALRRACLGVIRTVLENRLDAFMLTPCLQATLAGYPSRQGQVDQATQDLMAFFLDRLKVYLRDAGLRHDVAMAAMGREESLVRIWDKAQALQHFLQRSESAPLMQGFKRVSNILGAAKNHTPSSCDPLQFVEKEEQDLYQAFESASSHVNAHGKHFTRENLPPLFQSMTALTSPLDAFFEKVTVNVQDPKIQSNRLNLLNEIHCLFLHVLDFNALEG